MARKIDGVVVLGLQGVSRFARSFIKSWRVGRPQHRAETGISVSQLEADISTDLGVVVVTRSGTLRNDEEKGSV